MHSGFEIKSFLFDVPNHNVIGLDCYPKSRNWPVVYLIHNERELYVGETNNALNRMYQHLDNTERQHLKHVRIIFDEEYNKSAILDIEQSLIHKMFVVHAEGKSMEPKIHDGDLCVFDATGAGSREGKIVLCKAKDKNDPKASSFTIKQYSSKKSTDEDGNWHHSRITLSPLNREYLPIVIDSNEAEEEEFCIYGELVQVISE